MSTKRGSKFPENHTFERLVQFLRGFKLIRIGFRSKIVNCVGKVNANFYGKIVIAG